MANRYMNTFRDEILGWNKKLMNVADVNQIMTEIQRTWAYLESLFIHSEEVKKELPEAATRFANIDKEVKIILKVGRLPPHGFSSACAHLLPSSAMMHLNQQHVLWADLPTLLPSPHPPLVLRLWHSHVVFVVLAKQPKPFHQ